MADLSDYSLEPMTADHQGAVMGILNYYIETSFAAYAETPMPAEEAFGPLLNLAKGHPALVAVTPAGEVVAFAFARPFHHADTMRRTAEVAYFVRPEHTRRGLGGAMLGRLAEAARARGVDNFLAGISSLNPASLAFHRKHGFEECGRFKAVGRKRSRDFDVVWMQKRL